MKSLGFFSNYIIEKQLLRIKNSNIIEYSTPAEPSRNLHPETSTVYDINDECSLRRNPLVQNQGIVKQMLILRKART